MDIDTGTLPHYSRGKQVEKFAKAGEEIWLSMEFKSLLQESEFIGCNIVSIVNNNAVEWLDRF